MKRRQFIGITLPATGAILAAPGLMNFQIRKEIMHQFTGESAVDEYDVIINGAGLAGYFAAIEAANQGKSVLIVDKRSSPGYEITAKYKLWLNTDGIDTLSNDMTQLLTPEAEKMEIHNDNAVNSVIGNELLLMNGSIRKGMLRNLLVKKVHVLLMTDVCGVVSDKKNVTGVMVASKYGIHTLRCRNFVDASDNLLLTRKLNGSSTKVDRVGFVLEVHNTKNPENKEIKVAEKYGLVNNSMRMHSGKHLDHQSFLEFEFSSTSGKLEDIEMEARMISAQLGKDLESLDTSLVGASINQFPLECSFTLNDTKAPKAPLKGYYTITNESFKGKCADLNTLASEAQKLVSGIKSGSPAKSTTIFTPDGEIPIDQVTFSDPDDPGLYMPLKNCSFDYSRWIKQKDQCQVVVAGGGTAGAMAAMGSAEKKARTYVVDYFNDLGGTKTVGCVMGYYHGFKSHKFFKQQDEKSSQISHDHNMNNRVGRKLFHLSEVNSSGNKFISGAILCGSLSTDKKVNGIVVCRHGQLEQIQASITIDATGDGDIAAFAGANFWHGDSRTGLTQNYSQWDKNSKGSFQTTDYHRDYDIIDNTKMSELQRGLFLSHYEAMCYDFSPMLTVRESRRIEGMHTLDLIDAVENTHFEDVMTYASSDFDPHNVGSSEYSKCGFLLPHSNDLVMEIPYKSIVPRDIDGLLLSGRGISQTHNALQFTRMSGDLAVLGYLTGQVAADQAWNNIQPRDYDISAIQEEWAQLGFMAPDYSTKRVGNTIRDQDEVERRVKELSLGKKEFLYESIKLPKEDAIPVLYRYFNSTSNKEAKLLLAKALAWFGESEGNELIIEDLKYLFQEEGKIDMTGYVDTYDDIRGRPKNILEGVYWRINQNIALLAMSGSPQGKEVIRDIIENTVSGGGMMDRENLYFNGRIDLKLVPFHNRISSLCFYAERLPDHSFIQGFEKLLEDENIGDYKTETYQDVRWRVYGGSLELSIGAALARCGSKTGYDLLATYLDDIHYNFKDFASRELAVLTGENFKYNAKKWKAYLSGLSYPQRVQNLNKEIEV